MMACGVTLLAAVCLSILSPSEQLPSSIATDDDDLTAAATSGAKDAFQLHFDDLQIPLSETFAVHRDDEGSDNYDDTLPESAFADSDDLLDDQVKTLAARDGGRRIEEFKWFEEDVQKGDTISSIFSDLNIPASVTMAILDNKQVAKQVNTLRLGEKISFLLDDKSRLMSFVKPMGKDQQIRFFRDDADNPNFSYVIEKAGEHLSDTGGSVIASLSSKDATATADGSGKKDLTADASAKPAATADTKPKVSLHDSRGRLVIVNIQKGETFSTAANNAGVSYTEINQILNLFKGRIQFSRNIRPGDSMRVLFTEAKGKGKISAVEFNLQGRKVSAFLNSKDGKYYDERGISSTSNNGFRRFPFNSRARVTSPFNPSRKHPVTGRTRPHYGTDFGMPVGTQILAPADGVVSVASFTRSTGYYIVLKHRGGYSTVYMHLSKLGVKVGQNVKMGSVIARSGNTGLSTGPHLHYELRINGRAVNAMRVKLGNIQEQAGTAERKRFAANIASYKRDLYNQNLLAKR